MKKKTITRADARKLLNCKSNWALYKALDGRVHQQIYDWPENKPIPPSAYWQVRALVAERKLAEIETEQAIRRSAQTGNRNG